MRKLLLTLLISISCAATFAQDTTELHPVQDKLLLLLDSCYSASSDSMKILLADEAAINLESTMKVQSAFGYNFYKLRHISSLTSENQKLRVITFGVALSDGTYCYEGMMVYNNSGDITVTRLHQTKDRPKNPFTANMQKDNWYGAVYYEIRQFGNKKNPVYALCGWDGSDMFTNRKVLEQVSISQTGTPKFGGSFQNEFGAGYQRIVFEFSEKAVMTLRYDTKLKMIVADHLNAPAQFRGNTRFYGPDMTFDGYIYEDGKWIYEPDVDVKLDK